MTSDTTIAQLHGVLQIAIGWKDLHLHQFRMHGKASGVYRAGGMLFADDPHAVVLADFTPRCFRRVGSGGEGITQRERVRQNLQAIPFIAYCVRAIVGDDASIGVRPDEMHEHDRDIPHIPQISDLEVINGEIVEERNELIVRLAASLITAEITIGSGEIEAIDGGEVTGDDGCLWSAGHAGVVSGGRGGRSDGQEAEGKEEHKNEGGEVEEERAGCHTHPPIRAGQERQQRTPCAGSAAVSCSPASRSA